jgi:hypothetical protein
MTIIAFGFFLYGLATGPAGSFALLALVPLAAWLTLLTRWLTRLPNMSPREHKVGMYLALQAWALTNGCLLAAVFAPSLV